MREYSRLLADAIIARPIAILHAGIRIEELQFQKDCGIIIRDNPI